MCSDIEMSYSIMVSVRQLILIVAPEAINIVTLDYVYTTPERNNVGRIYMRLHYTVILF